MIKRKRFAIICAVLVTAIICAVTAAVACAGCSLFVKCKFGYREFDGNSDVYYCNGEYDDTDGYTVDLDVASNFKDKITKIENIPTEYNGKPVVEVDFNGAGVTNLVIPEGIKYVKLWWCSELKSITLPSTMRIIFGFSNCSSLESITIPEGTLKIAYDAFSGCTKLKEIKIPASLTDIDLEAFSTEYRTNCYLYDDTSNWVDGAFYLDNHLIWAGENVGNTYTIKEGTTTICNGAFDSEGNADRWSDGKLVKDLESVDIPKSVKYIGKGAFYNKSKPKLNQVYFGGSITDWCAINFGNEYSNPVYSYYTVNKSDMGKEGYETKLYYQEDGKDVLAETVDIPFRATTVNDYAFAGFSCLKYFHLIQNPISHVTYIGKSAFEGCVNLTNIDLGSGEITEIGEDAFLNCKKIQYVRIYSDRYRSFEYTSEDKSSWVTYNCIIDVQEKIVRLLTASEVYIPLFVESLDPSGMVNDIPVIRYEGTQEQWYEVTGHYNRPDVDQMIYEYKVGE